MSGRRRKNRLVPLLLLLLLAAALIIVFILIKNKNSGEEDPAEETEETETIALAEYSLDDFQSLTLTNAEFSGTLVYADEVWRLSDIPNFPLDQTKAASMVNGILAASANKIISDDGSASLGEYGLAAPEIKAVLSLKDGTEFSLVLGDKLPTEADYYGMVSGTSKIYAVPSSVRSNLAYSRTSLLEKEEFDAIDTATIDRIMLSSEERGNFELVYEENNQYDKTGANTSPWYISEPYSMPHSADTTAVSDILANYGTISLTSCVDYGTDKYAEYGLDEPYAELYLSYKTVDGASSTPAADAGTSEAETDAATIPAQKQIYFGDQDEDGNYYVRFEGSDRIYLMSETTADGLITFDTFALTDTFVHLLNIKSVSRIDVAFEDEEHHYELAYSSDEEDDGSFKADGTDIVEGEASFRTLYQGIIGLQYAGLLTGDALESAETEPYLTLKFTRPDSSMPEIEAKYYKYSESYAAVELDGERLFYVDIRTLDDLIKMIKEYVPA